MDQTNVYSQATVNFKKMLCMLCRGNRFKKLALKSGFARSVKQNSVGTHLEVKCLITVED